MDRLNAANIFVHVVELGSMAAAAKALDISRSAVTRNLAYLESWSSARLLHRSTRQLSLTPAGEQVLEHCRQLLSVSELIPQGLDSQQQDGIRGTLRISCSQFLAESLMIDVINDYAALYPDVKIEMRVASRKVNLVERRIDLAIRIAKELDPNLISRPLGDCDSVLCASPAYIKKHGLPQSIDELDAHNCLLYSAFEEQQAWQFSRHDECVRAPITGNFNANESNVLQQATLAGMGIGHLPLISAEPFISSGKLIPLLPDWRPEPLGIYAVYHSRKNMSLALRYLIDMLVEHFQRQSYSAQTTLQ